MTSESSVPYWGLPNSSVNWCEYDYVYTRYIAEFFNSLSSLCMTAFGVYGRYTMLKPIAGDKVLANPSINGLDRIWWTWVMLEIVGWGSVAFHGTLKWWSQALDEVPMVWTSALILTTALTARYEKVWNRKSTLYTIFKPFTPIPDPATDHTPILTPAMWLYITACSLLITAFRGPTQFFLFHLLFASLEVSAFVFLTFIYLERHQVEYPKSHEALIKKCFTRGAVSYGVGIIVWALDLHFCDYWRIGGWQVQGHAWWHLLVSNGFYHLHVVAIYDRLLTTYRSKDAERGPVITWEDGVLPVVKMMDHIDEKKVQ